MYPTLGPSRIDAPMPAGRTHDTRVTRSVRSHRREGTRPERPGPFAELVLHGS